MSRAFTWSLLILALVAIFAGNGFSTAPAFAQIPPTQCVVGAVAGGTANALTITQLPCIPTTALLELTTPLSNTSSSPTLQYTGGPAQVILNYNGSTLGPGGLTAGSRYLLINNGQNWYILTNNLGAITSVQSATNISALKAIPVTQGAGFTVNVLGYNSVGDMPSDLYYLSHSACSDNSGAGDGGSQIPSNTSGWCWLLVPGPNLNVQNFGVVIGGTDPSGTNAEQMNAMMTYAGTLSAHTNPGEFDGTVDLNGNGANVALCSPFDITAPGIIVRNFQFTLASTSCDSNFSLGTVSAGEVSGATGLVLLDSTGTVMLDNINIDLAAGSSYLNQPVNGLVLVRNGAHSLSKVQIKHWGQGTTPYTLIGSAGGAGFYTITTSNTSNVAVGMISRGNANLPDQSVIIQVNTNSSIVVSQPTTGAISNTTLNFYLDASGIIADAGARTFDLNIFQYNAGDSNVWNEADRAGYGVWFQGSVDMWMDQGQYEFGVSPIFMDNAAGVYISGSQIQNGTGGAYTPSCTAGSQIACNSPLALVSGGSDGFTLNNVIMINGVVQYFQLDTTPIVMSISDIKANSASGLDANPNNWLQIFTNQTNTSLCRMIIPPSFQNTNANPDEITLIGTGSFAGLGNNNITNISETSNGVVFSGCGSLYVATGLALETPLLEVGEPTISSGFGTSAAIALANGSAAFTINVGTSSADTGVIGLPLNNGWVCQGADITSPQFIVRQRNYTGSSVTLGFYNTSNTLASPNDNDIITVSCSALGS